MKFNQALPYIAILLFVSCSTPKFVTSGEEYPKLHLDLGIDCIVVKDKRGNISISDDLELPFISKAGQSDIVVPPLKNEYEAIIKQTVVDNLKPNSKNTAILTIHVINARKEFHVTSWSERETAFIELKIFVKSNGQEFEANASGEFMRKSVDATHKKSEKIFKSTLKEVTYEALKKLENKISG